MFRHCIFLNYLRMRTLLSAWLSKYSPAHLYILLNKNWFHFPTTFLSSPPPSILSSVSHN